MLEYLSKQIGESLDDASYSARRVVTQIIGKGGIKEVLGPALMSIAGFAHGSVSGALLIAAPLSAALGSAMVQGDHIHRRKQVLNQYRREIASWLGDGRKPDEMTEADLDLAARGDEKRGIKANPTLNEALDQSKKARNWGVGISILSSVISTVLVTALLGEGQALHELSTGAATLAAGAIGYGVYLPISTAMHWMAEQMFGLEKVTINDRIREMHRTHEHGKSITQEQVFEAFVEAHPQLDDAIRTGYGRRFEKLGSGAKTKVIEQIGPRLGLEQITSDVNTGRMRVEELAFVIHGQYSGVSPMEPVGPEIHHSGWLKQGWDHCLALLSGPKSEAPEQAVSIRMQSPDGNAQLDVQAYAEDKPARKTSFVQMVGKRRGNDGSLSFVEQVEQSRTGEVQI